MALTIADTRRPSAVRKVLRRPQFWVGGIVLVITFAWYGTFVFAPMVKTLTMSFQRYRVLNPAASPFVGFSNFTNLFVYDRFWIAVGNTALYTLLLYVFSLPLSLLLAWCLAKVTHGRRAYQFIVFLPVVVSLVAVSMLFRMIMNPDTGTLNRILVALHLPRSQWIYGSDSALYSVVLVDVWKSLGFYVLLLTAAILAVPRELEEAARIDGAGHWRIFWHVILPSIMPTLSAVSVITVINGMQVYITPTVLGPGPGTSTLMINQFIVGEAFTSFNFSNAAAVSVLLFLLMLIVTLVQLWLLRTKD